MPAESSRQARQPVNRTALSRSQVAAMTFRTMRRSCLCALRGPSQQTWIVGDGQAEPAVSVNAPASVPSAQKAAPAMQASLDFFGIDILGSNVTDTYI